MKAILTGLKGVIYYMSFPAPQFWVGLMPVLINISLSHLGISVRIPNIVVGVGGVLAIVGLIRLLIRAK